MRCPECEVEFQPKREWQKFCTPECRWKNWDRGHPRQPNASKPVQAVGKKRKAARP